MTDGDEYLVVENEPNSHIALANDLEVADSWIRRGIGLMFRRRIDSDSAMIFEFESVDERELAMMFVPFDLDVVWIDGSVVTKTARLEAWTGHDSGQADRVVEMAAGAAARVDVGDRVQVVEL
jgi:uncharacterized membrane protein (UPF0127 family)